MTLKDFRLTTTGNEMLNTVRIMINSENGDPEFWSELDAQFPDIADRLHTVECTQVTREEWNAIQTFPGFHNGVLFVVDDGNPNNDERKHRAFAAWDAYLTAYGDEHCEESDQHLLTDLLTDLRHFAGTLQVNFDTSVRVSEYHWLEERNED